MSARYASAKPSASASGSVVSSRLGGIVIRACVGDQLGLAILTFVFTNVSLMVFHLLPIPGLDGGRLLALLLPPHAREVFRNADRYLALIVLVVLFLFTFLLGVARLLAGAVCDALSGVDCSGLFRF